MPTRKPAQQYRWLYRLASGSLVAVRASTQNKAYSILCHRYEEHATGATLCNRTLAKPTTIQKTKEARRIQPALRLGGL